MKGEDWLWPSAVLVIVTAVVFYAILGWAVVKMVLHFTG